MMILKFVSEHSMFCGRNAPLMMNAIIGTRVISSKKKKGKKKKAALITHRDFAVSRKNFMMMVC